MLKKRPIIAPLFTFVAASIYIWSMSAGARPNEQIQLRGTDSSISPLYRSSVVGTDFDFIIDKDPSAFTHLEYVGFKKFEMPDKRKLGDPLIQNAYIFNAYFNDGTKVGIASDQDFGSRQAAEQDVLRYMSPLGKLPSLYRQNLKHVVVHTGGADTTAFAEDKGRFFVIYSDNATKRIGSHDLEETFFHEGTHSSIQTRFLRGEPWETAKSLDNAFITDYAKTSDQEDFAESALFAYTLIYHPERFPAAERKGIEKQIPGRIAFFKTVFRFPPAPPAPPPPSARSY